MEIVSKEDFDDLSNINNLSPFEMLLLVAEKASEKEKKVNSKVDIPMQESRTLPFDLNSTPSTSKQQRITPAKRHCSPVDVDVDVDAFFPCKKINNVYRRRTPSPSPSPPPPVAPPADLPEIFWRRIRQLGGSNPEFVMKKIITNTDKNPNQTRLSMPLSRCSVHFDRKNVPVKVIQPDLRICTLILTKWVKSYILKGGWGQLLMRNPDLQAGNIVHIWRFQLPSSSNYECGFALVNVSD